MNKKTLLVTIIVLITIAIWIGVAIFSANDFWYAGGVWYDTPSEALLHEADKDLESKEILSVKTLLNTTKIDDITIMTFVSRNDTLTTVTFVSNDEGLYSVSGYTNELSLDSPTEFVVTGDKDQFILFPYSTYGNTVYGWCYANVEPTVNGLIPTFTPYEFESQESVWHLNFWCISGIDDINNINVSFNRK